MTNSEKIKEAGPVTCFICISAALPIAMLVMGAIHLDNCPAERFIPIYLILCGCFSVVLAVILVLGTWVVVEEGKKPRAIWGLSLLILLLMTPCFIAGTVLTYRIHNTYDPDNVLAPNYCHNTFYLFAFWVTTGVYILLVLSMLIGCCAAVFSFGVLMCVLRDCKERHDKRLRGQ